MPRIRLAVLLSALLALGAGKAAAIDGGALARSGDRLSRATVGVGTLAENDDRIGLNRCSGVLVAPDLVLTASHCVRGDRVASVVILYEGSRALRPFIPVASIARYDIPSEAPSDLAGLQALTLDTALLRLSTPVRGRAPIAVARRGVPPRGLRLAGAGLSFEGAGVLKTTRLDPVLLTGTGLLIARTRGSEVCTGDSGGPVVADGPRGPVLWGVASAVLTNNPPCGRTVVVAPASNF